MHSVMEHRDFAAVRTVDSAQARAPVSVRTGVLRPVALVQRLAGLLVEERIGHCQWRITDSHRQNAGRPDHVDLLLAPRDATRFHGVAARLDFKPLTPGAASVPATERYVGLDRASRRLVYLRVRYRVTVGRPRGPLYSLPMERALLASARKRDGFAVPEPSLELIAATLHRLLCEAVPAAAGAQDEAVQRDLAALQREADPAQVVDALQRHLPELDPALFTDCVAALVAPGTDRARTRLRRRVRHALRSRLLPPLIATRFHRSPHAQHAGLALPERRLATGGIVVALSARDGVDALESGAYARALRRWLAPSLAVHHLNLDTAPRSVWTRITGALCRITAAGTTAQRPQGLLPLLHEVAVARDRGRLHHRAVRDARLGAVVVWEDYLLPHRSGTAMGAASPGGTRAEVPGGTRSSVPGGPRSAVPGGRLMSLAERLRAAAVKPLDPPDAVLVLQPRPAPAMRAAAGRTHATLINAAQDRSLVLERLKDALWRSL
jgi:hypothetical protein